MDKSYLFIYNNQKSTVEQNKMNNICKFIYGKTSESIMTENFVLETKGMESFMISQNEKMVLVCAGKGVYYSDAGETELTSGKLLFVFAGTEYMIKNTDNLQYMYIDFYGNRCSDLYRRFGINRMSYVFFGFDGLVPIWMESLVRADGKNIDLLSESMLLYAFSRLSEVNKKSKSALNEILLYLDDHFTENDVSLVNTADRFGYNPKYLSHLFKSSTNMTFSEYLKNLRMKHAILLMEEGVTSVKNIALLSGYTDPLYFSRVFEKTFGMSPTAYIEKSENE